MKTTKGFKKLLFENSSLYSQSFFYFLIKHSSSWLLPIIIAQVINTLITGGFDELWSLRYEVLIYFGLLSLNLPFHYLHIRTLSKANRNIESKLRSWLIRKLQQLTISFHVDYQSGKLHAKFIRDIEAIETMLRQGARTLLPAVTTVIYVIIVTAAKQPIMTAFFALIVPIVILLRRFFKAKMARRNRRYRKSMENLSARLSDSLEMLPVARAHAVEKYEVQQMEKHFSIVRQEGISVDMVNSIFSSSSWMVVQFFGFSCLLFSGFLASKNYIQVGDIVMYQTFFSMLTGSLSAVLASYPLFAKGMDSASSITEILDSPDLEYNIGKKPFKHIEGNFDLRNVSFNYESEIKALDDISFTVKKGETIALTGSSGSGKTTLINLVIGFLRPVSGVILLDGQDCADHDMRSLRKNLAVVSQNPVLLYGTIRENLTYGSKEISDDAIMAALADANAAEFVQKMDEGIDTIIGEHGATLSGGQKQRLVLARAILRNPKILIFDEATSALDTESESLVQSAITKLIQGRTTFIVAHRYSTIRDADKVLYLDEGKIVESGTITELMDLGGRFAKAAKLQGLLD
jgi:ATP-binding cassette, subfamily B, bacterial